MHHDAKIIGILSIKGGVGKTSCTVNLGAALAGEFNKKTLLVDGNYSAPNLGLHFGLAEPKATIHDVLLNNRPLAEAIHNFSENLDVIPGDLLGKKIHPNLLKQRVGELRQDYDIILIDSSPNLSQETLSTLLASDELLVVTTPDYPTLSCTLRAVNIAALKDIPINGLVVNRVTGKKHELKASEIQSISEVPVLAVLPHDMKIYEALSLGQPLAVHKPNSNLDIGYKTLAAGIIGQKYIDKRIIPRLKALFNKLKKND